MPNKPLHPCNYPGCPKLTTRRYCETHDKQVNKSYEVNRETAVQRGYNHRWHKASKRFLDEHPLCAECQRQGYDTAATVVDHKKPHKGNQELFWDEDNWQSLCALCHDIKTAKEDGGFGNRSKNK
jgi:5-methylcytosine-specific restriction protein A